MPTVPDSDSLGYAPVGALPSVRATPADFGSQIGQAAQQVGQAFDQVNQTATQLQGIQAEADNNQRFTQLRNYVQKVNYGDPNDPNDRGLYALKGSDYIAAYPKALKGITDLQASLTQGVAPLYRGQFDQISRRLIDPDLQTMGRTYVDQTNVFANDTSNARIEAAHSDAIANYNNPAKFNNALADSKNQVIIQGQRNGLPPEMIEQNVADNQSKLLAGVTMRIAQENPLSGYQFYQQHSSMIAGPYQAQIEKELAPQVNVWKSRQDADSIMSGSTAQTAANITSEAAQQNVDPQLALTTARIESGMGRALVNPNSTAKGVFQLTDGTWQAQGGTSANRDDPAAQVQLGVKSLGQSVQAATAALGRPAEPWESYLVHQQGAGGGPALLKASPDANAIDTLAPLYANSGGFPAARQAIVNNGGSLDMTVAQFLDATKARYLAASSATSVPALPSAPASPNSASSASATSTPASGAPTDPRANVAGWLQQAQGIPDFRGNQDPNYQALVSERIRQKAAEMEYGQAQLDRANRNTLVTAAMGAGSGIGGALGAASTGAAGGTPGAIAATAPPTSLEEMFTRSPSSQAAFYSAEPETQHAIMEMLRGNATQGPPATEAAIDKYYQLRGLSTNDPAAFLNTNLADHDLVTTLPREYLDQLINIQAGMDKNAVSQQQRQVTMTHARQVVMPDLLAAGINPAKAGANPALAQTYSAFDGRLEEAIQQFQADNKRRPNDAEIKTLGQTLLTPGYLKGTGSLWGMLPNDSSTRLFQAQTGGQVGQFYPAVPSTDRQGIIAAYRAKNGTAPTESQIQGYYMMGLQRQQSGSSARSGRPSLGTPAPRGLLPPAQVDSDSAGADYPGTG